MRTTELRGLLRRRVLGPEGQGAKAVLLEEVPSGTGFTSDGRSLDAVSMGMWPSRGCLIEGYELKVSRGDWLGELKEPEKAEAIARFCDRFWLVVGDERVIRPGEVPPLWGILRARGRRLECDREASPLDAHDRPAAFVAALLRRAVKADMRREIKVAKEEAKREAEFRARSRVGELERRVEARDIELETFRTYWQKFEDVAGVPFPRFLDQSEELIEKTASVARSILAAEGGQHGPLAELDRVLVRMDSARASLADARRKLAEDDEEEVAPTINP